MEKQNNQTSPFWIGFLFGVLSAGTVSFLFGTKNGRQNLKKILDLSENLEDNLTTIKEIIEEKLEDMQDETTNLSNPKKKESSDRDTNHNFFNMNSVLSKIQDLLPSQKSEAKKVFFRK